MSVVDSLCHLESHVDGEVPGPSPDVQLVEPEEFCQVLGQATTQDQTGREVRILELQVTLKADNSFISRHVRIMQSRARLVKRSGDDTDLKVMYDRVFFVLESFSKVQLLVGVLVFQHFLQVASIYPPGLMDENVPIDSPIKRFPHLHHRS